VSRNLLSLPQLVLAVLGKRGNGGFVGILALVAPDGTSGARKRVTSMGGKAAAEKDKDRKPHFRVHIHGFVSPFDSLKNQRFSIAFR